LTFLRALPANNSTALPENGINQRFPRAFFEIPHICQELHPCDSSKYHVIIQAKNCDQFSNGTVEDTGSKMEQPPLPCQG
jgi:hypothetical protein